MRYPTPLKKIFRLPEFIPDPKKTALLIIDMQYLDAHPDHGICKIARERGLEKEFKYYCEERLKLITTNLQKLLGFFRDKGLTVVHVRIASLTSDGKDRGLLHKIAGVHAPLGSRDAEILEELKPLPDEVVLSKTCSSPFNCTHIETILRNMNIEYLIVGGVVTDQCVETTARDAADRGFRVILVEDGCATILPEMHEATLRELDGVYCHVKSTDEVIELLLKAIGSG